MVSEMCTRCKKAYSIHGRAWCEECILWARDKGRRQYARRVAIGQCGRCSKPALPGESRCAKHKKMNLKRTRPPRTDTNIRQKLYADMGFCRCGNERFPGRLSCRRCLELALARHFRRASKANT